MGIGDSLLTALGLAMDAFAVAVCKGLSAKKVEFKHYLWVGLWFGGFQALMPTVGYFLGSAFKDYITAFSHWIAFALLALIGANMIKEGLSKADACGEEDGSFAVRTMFVMAIATSIDALAVGVGYGALPDVNIVVAVAAIGVITFLMSALGLKLGNVFGLKYKSKAEIAGGVILILMGVKILLEHFGVISF